MNHSMPPGTSRLSALFRGQGHYPPWLMSLLGLLLVFLLACVLTPVTRRTGAMVFLTPGNLSDILRQVSVKGILAVGMTLVIIAGGIDLGVGSLLALCATITAILCLYGQWGATETIIAVLLMGATLGLFNGAVIAKGRIQPFVVTLAMMLAARGLARIVSGGAGVGLSFPTPQDAPHGYLDRLWQWPSLAGLLGGLALIGAAIAAGSGALYGVSRLARPRQEGAGNPLRWVGLFLPGAGALVGMYVAVSMRLGMMPASATATTRNMLLASALLAGAAVGAVVFWGLLLALRWLTARRRPLRTLVGINAAVVLTFAVGWMCWYLTGLSQAWRMGAEGRPPLSLKVLALRFGPPIEGWTDIIPAPAVIFLLIVVAAHFLMTRTRFGRHVYAVGGNERAARYSGINVDSVKMRVYAIAGLLAAVAGIIHSAQLEQGNPNDGFAYELDAIAAVVVGGTLLSGGVGSVIGTLFGVLIIGVIDNIMGLHVDKIDSNWQLIAKGGIIIITVLLQRRRL